MWSRVKGVIYQDLAIGRRESAMLFDLIAFPIFTLLGFGLLARFLSRSSPVSGKYLILGLLLWELLRVTQYSISLNGMWNLWSRNVCNLFVSPLSHNEYLIANCIAGVVNALTVFAVMSVIADLVFGFAVLSAGVISITLSGLILILFGCGLGWPLLTVVFRYGTGIQAVTWGATYFIQPLVAAFFPVSVLPRGVQIISFALPPTYAFEGARRALTGSGVAWGLYGFGLLLSLVWTVVCIALGNFLITSARATGQLARNDS